MYKIIFTTIIALSVTITNSQWQPTSGPTGGNISCFAVSGSNIFAGSTGNGVFISNNNGISWNSVSRGLISSYIISLAAIGTNIFAGSLGRGISISHNNGTTWESFNKLGNHTIYSLIALETDIYAGTDQGFYKSSDNGANWNLLINNGLPFLIKISTLAVSGTTIYAGSNSNNTSFGVYKSDDKGTSWTKTNFPNDVYYSLASKGSNVCAGIANSGVYYSTNFGLTSAQSNLATNVRVNALAFYGGKWFTGDSYMYSSMDNGMTWQIITNGIQNTGIQKFNAFAVIGSTLLVGTNNGIYSTIDTGKVWIERNSGLLNTQVNSVEILGSNIFVGTTNTLLGNSLSLHKGTFLSTDMGDNWTSINNGIKTYDNFVVNSFVSNGTKIFANAIGEVYSSIDTGKSWKIINTGPYSEVLILGLVGTDIYASSQRRSLIKSTDGD